MKHVLAGLLLASVLACSPALFAGSESETPGESSSKPSAEAAPAPAADAIQSARPVPCSAEDARGCKFKWRAALTQTFSFLAFQHVTNISTYHVPHDHFFSRWADSVSHYRLDRWDDGDPFMVNFVGHPMMGAVVGFIEVQNDPGGSRQTFGKSKQYWVSRLRGTAWTAAYALQWELGPMSEASFGGLGSYIYWQKDTHQYTNGTGLVDIVMTPTGGTGWMIAEDALDRYAIRRLERISRNPAWLLGISFLNPNRSLANMLRLKSPWYRDTRRVR